MERVTRKVLLRATTLVILCAAVFAGAGYRTSQHLRSTLIDESEESSLAAATGFAETVSEWILTDSLQHLERGVEIMLLGSSRYVQIGYEDRMLIDGRAEEWEQAALPSVDRLPARATVHTLPLKGHLIIETTLPLRERSFTVGFVRVGTYSQLLESRLQRLNWLLGAVGAILWLFAAAAICWIVIRQARRTATASIGESLGNVAPLRELFAQRPIVIDLRARTISCQGESRLLTPKPFGLLTLLLSDSSHIFSDREIMEAIWPDCRYTSANDVHQCVYRLRRLLNDIDPDLGLCIANVKGFGYRFEANDRVGFEGVDFEHARSQ
ncbi:winged helix-turn-helix domain-containing protein [Candidatus Bipolaricaulota bacterium]|nr:winged helix-turn-helix domain-containing protein [Candidatus Bipolaricaulota bacterium]